MKIPHFIICAIDQTPVVCIPLNALHQQVLSAQYMLNGGVALFKHKCLCSFHNNGQYHIRAGTIPARTCVLVYNYFAIFFVAKARVQFCDYMYILAT
jgi:hypothetical protein